MIFWVRHFGQKGVRLFWPKVVQFLSINSRTFRLNNSYLTYIIVQTAPRE